MSDPASDYTNHHRPADEDSDSEGTTRSDRLVWTLAFAAVILLLAALLLQF